MLTKVWQLIRFVTSNRYAMELTGIWQSFTNWSMAPPQVFRKAYFRYSRFLVTKVTQANFQVLVSNLSDCFHWLETRKELQYHLTSCTIAATSQPQTSTFVKYCISSCRTENASSGMNCSLLKIQHITVSQWWFVFLLWQHKLY